MEINGAKQWINIYGEDINNPVLLYLHGDPDSSTNLLMEDGREITEFIIDYMNKEKITILGHPWGSIYGANLVLRYPDYYDCFIGTCQLVDSVENEVVFKMKLVKERGEK